MRKRISSLCLTVTLLLTAVAAHALTPNYNSTFAPATPTTLSADGYATLLFSATPGSFTSATLDLNVTDLANASRRIGLTTYVSPPSGEFLSEATGTYLFTTDLKTGLNSFSLNSFLPELNTAKNGTGIYLGVLLDRGSITFDKARLSGTVAPEPASMALVAAGLVGLPFARRFRKYLR